MVKYYHAQKVDNRKCRGHMTCMRRCPTQAIRVRGGRTTISEELCVDCGACIAACPEEAIIAAADTVAETSRFKYNVIVPSPVVYSQVEPGIHPYVIHLALMKLGFDKVVDIHRAAAALDRAVLDFTAKYTGRLPLISSSCPSIVRWIQVKYPDLVELIVPLDVPREITARRIRQDLPDQLGLKEDEIGIFYIAPCPAIAVSVVQPAEKEKSCFDGVISTKDAFSVIMPQIASLKDRFDIGQVPDDFVFNAGWAPLGSISQAAETENWLAVSGPEHVKMTLDDIENSKLRNVDFVEARACLLGCVGGPFNIENPYVARANGMKQREKYEQPVTLDLRDFERKLADGFYSADDPILPRPISYFDTDLETSIRRMKERERVYRSLKQIDCGCCGSPTCLAFAEDFVHGEVELTDCIFLTGEGAGGE